MIGGVVFVVGLVLGCFGLVVCWDVMFSVFGVG